MRIQPFEFTSFEPAGTGGTPLIDPLNDTNFIKQFPSAKSKKNNEQASPPPPPPENTFTEDELKAREAVAFAKGLTQGKEEGYNAAKAEMQANLDAISNAMTQIEHHLKISVAEYKKNIETDSNTIKSIISAAIKRIIGNTDSHQAIQIITEELPKYLTRLTSQPKLFLTVHPEISNNISEQMNEIKTNCMYDGEVVIKADSSMDIADMKLHWSSGKLERTTTTIVKEIEDILNKTID